MNISTILFLLQSKSGLCDSNHMEGTMQYKVKYIFSIILIFILVACNNKYIFAAELNNNKVAETQQFAIDKKIDSKSEEDHLAVVVVMDTSKSMATTDPNNFRKTAANIFIDLLNPEDYLGILTFNHEITVVGELSKVKDYDNKTKLKNNLIPYIETNGNTDYQKALQSAANQLDQIEDGNVKKAILFITDGEPDPDPNRSIKEPEYMTTYMKSVWKTVDDLSAKLYPVYSIGFSEGIKSDILDQISTKTGGTFQVLNDSNSLTTSIFEMYGKMTNRINSIDKSINLDTDSIFPIVIDKKTKKLTMLILGDVKSAYEVEIHNPDKKNVNDKCNLIVNDGYTIVDINSEDKKLSTEGNYLSKGTWKLHINGEGKVQVIGNMDVLDADRNIPSLVHDFYIKNEGYRIGEKVSITSSLIKGVGRLQQGNGLEIDSYYVLIHSANISTGINHDINPNTFNKKITSEKIKLYDDGLKIHNDFIKGDGIWSNSITFSKESISSASILVNGTYNSDNFTIEEKIGTYKVVPPGNIIITQVDKLKDRKVTSNSTENDVANNSMEDNVANNSMKKSVTSNSTKNIVASNSTEDNFFYIKKGGTLTIPIKIENTSWFTESLNLRIEGNIGSLSQSKITLKPREIIEYPVEIIFLKDLKKDATDSIQNIKITFQPEYATTTINKSELNVQVKLKSSYKLKVLNIRKSIINLKTTIFFTFIVIIFFICNGKVLYYIFFHHLKYVNGILTFYLKDEDDPVKTHLVFCLPGLNKKSLVISFNIENPEIDYYIGGTNFDYDIIISTNYGVTKLTFLEGWKALFSKAKPVYYYINTTIPGIIEKNGQVCTRMKLVDNEIFETGDYIFQFSVPINRFNRNGLGS